MANPTSDQLFSFWKPVRDALEELLDDGLTNFGGFLGAEFTVDDLPPGHTPEQLKYHLAAIDLLSKLNTVKETLELDRPQEKQDTLDVLFGGDSIIDIGDEWPNNDTTFDFYNSTVIPVFLQIIEDLKVIQENTLLSLIATGDEDKFDNLFNWGSAPPEDLPELIEAVLDTVPDFLLNFPDFSVSLKRDIDPLPGTEGLGPTPILSDANLEKSLKKLDPNLGYRGSRSTNTLYWLFN